MRRHNFEDGAILLPYEFDAATMLYGDIRSVVDHHDRNKSQCSPYLRSLYDLRSGVVLHVAWVISKIMNRYVAAAGLQPEDFKPLGVLQASLGGLDPVTDAIGYLDSALEDNPELAEALYHKGLMLAALGDHSSAITVFQTASGLLPAIIPSAHDIFLESRVLFDCGRSLEACDRFEEASACYERAIEFVPVFPDAQRRYAACLRRSGKWGAAAEHLDRAMVHRSILPTLPKLPTPTTLASGEILHPPRFRGDLDDGPRRDFGQFIGGYNGFRIFWAASAFHAVPMSELVFDLRRAQAGEYAAWCVADTQERVRSQIDALPHLVEEGYRGFNIMQASGAYHAIPQGEGAFEMRRAQAGQYSHWFSHSDLKRVRSEIDAVVDLAFSTEAVTDSFSSTEFAEQEYRRYSVDLASEEYRPITAAKGALDLQHSKSGGDNLISILRRLTPRQVKRVVRPVFSALRRKD